MCRKGDWSDDMRAVYSWDCLDSSPDEVGWEPVNLKHSPIYPPRMFNQRAQFAQAAVMHV